MGAFALTPSTLAAASGRPAAGRDAVDLLGPQQQCIGNQWPNGQTGQAYFHAITGAHFDRVIGWETVRPLYPCEGLAGWGWAFAAAANVQGSAGIYQIGYWTDAGNAGDQPYFIYTDRDGSGQAVIINSPRPSLGVRCQFEVYKNSSGNVGYRIKDVNGALVWSASFSNTPWSSSLNVAWWGWEVANMNSALGYALGGAHADLVGIYSTSYSTSLVTVEPVNLGSIGPQQGLTY